MCEGCVEKESYALRWVPDHYKTQEMCESDVEESPETPEYYPDKYKTEEMRKRDAQGWWHALSDVSDLCKTKKCVKVLF